MVVMCVADLDPKTCPTLDAGSVLTSRTRLAPLGEAQRRGAGQRGLADAALAGEENELRKIFEHLGSDA